MFNDVIQTIGAAVIIPLVTILGKYLVDFIKATADKQIAAVESERTKEYLAVISSIVSQAVLSTTQTYVSEMKAAGTFDAQAHVNAFDKTRKTVVALLTSDMKDFIELVYGDLDLWVNTKIEQVLLEWKNEKGVL